MSHFYVQDRSVDISIILCSKMGYNQKVGIQNIVQLPIYIITFIIRFANHCVVEMIEYVSIFSKQCFKSITYLDTKVIVLCISLLNHKIAELVGLF